MAGFDLSRAQLAGKPMFEPFWVADGDQLKVAKLSPKTDLLVFERNGERRALLQAQMAYHHAAQGELGGEPFVISF